MTLNGRNRRAVSWNKDHRRDYSLDWISMKMKNLITAVLMTVVTTILLGLIYPLAVTGLAQLIFPDKANGQLIRASDGALIGSRLIGQPFSSAGYFRSRPSAAGAAG